MAYSSNKAPSRDSMADLTHPASDLRSDAKLGNAASNQERTTGSNARSVSTPVENVNGDRYMASDRNAGSLVKIGANTKGTDKLKVSTAIAMASKDNTKPAALNPDGAGRDRSATTKAPGVRK